MRRATALCAAALVTVVSGSAAAAAEAGSAAVAAAPRCDAPVRMADLGSDGRIGAKWNPATHRLAYGRVGPDGRYAAYTSDERGEQEAPIASPRWADAARHRFPAAWHPSGNWIVLLVEKASHERFAADAIPGYGAYTDYWIGRPDGSDARILYELPDGYDHAITHAAFSPDGRRFGWTERVKAPRLFDLNLFAGAYVFKVADVVLEPEPHLANVRVFRPGDVDQGGELESFAPDNRTIAFYSTFRSKNLFASRIYTMDIDDPSQIRELTTESFAQAPTYTPDGRQIVYMSGQGADIFPFQLQGADWWIMNADGSDKRRLTHMNQRGHAQSVGRFRLAGSLSFIDDTAFFGDVLTQSLGLVGKMVRVDCAG